MCLFGVLWGVCACVRSKGSVPVLVLQVCVCVDLRGNIPVLGSKGCALGLGSEESALVCPLWVVRGVCAYVESEECVPA